MEFWILHIGHRHGDNYSLHRMAEEAEQALHAYCLEEWDEGLSEQYGTPDSLTREDCVEAYFDAWGQALDSETYSLEPCTLKIPAADKIQALEHVIEELEEWRLGGDRKDAEGEATIAAARDAITAVTAQMASYPDMMSALEMAIAAMNRVPSFDTGIACGQTGRIMSSYQLLPKLEQALERARNHTSDRLALAEYLYRVEGYMPYPWGILDIRCAWAALHNAEPEDCPLTDEQCWDILERMRQNHDATIGINWDVINCYLDAVTS